MQTVLYPITYTFSGQIAMSMESTYGNWTSLLHSEVNNVTASSCNTYVDSNIPIKRFIGVGI